MIPFYALHCDVASLTHHVHLVCIVTQRSQQVQTALVTQCAQCLGSLMPAHGILLLVFQDAPQGRNSSIVSRLAETISEFVLEQSRR